MWASFARLVRRARTFLYWLLSAVSAYVVESLWGVVYWTSDQGFLTQADVDRLAGERVVAFDFHRVLDLLPREAQVEVIRWWEEQIRLGTVDRVIILSYLGWPSFWWSPLGRYLEDVLRRGRVVHYGLAPELLPYLVLCFTKDPLGWCKAALLQLCLWALLIDDCPDNIQAARALGIRVHQVQRTDASQVNVAALVQRLTVGLLPHQALVFPSSTLSSTLYEDGNTLYEKSHFV